MSVLPQFPVGRNPLRFFPLLPDFEAMSKKAQQPWNMCQRLEQRAYPIEICSPCQEKHWAGQLFVC